MRISQSPNHSSLALLGSRRRAGGAGCSGTVSRGAAVNDERRPEQVEDLIRQKSGQVAVGTHKGRHCSGGMAGCIRLATADCDFAR